MVIVVNVFAANDEVPIEGVISPKWKDIIIETDSKGMERLTESIMRLLFYKHFERASGVLPLISITCVVLSILRVLMLEFTLSKDNVELPTFH